MVAKSLSALLRSAANYAGPNADALVEGERRWSFSELLRDVQSLAAALQSKLGVKAGDHVALLFWNQPECWLSFQALRWLGAVPVPLNLSLPPEDLLYVIQNSDSVGVLADTELAQQLAEKLGAQALGNLPFWLVLSQPAEQAPLNQLPTIQGLLQAATASTDSLGCAADCLPVEINPEALAVLLYTSGTTGKPKGVMLSERNLLSNMESFTKQLNIGGQHRMLLGIPLFHAYGLICGLYSLNLGAPLVLAPRFHPKRIVQSLVGEKITMLPLVPTMYQLVAELAAKQEPGSLDALKICISGGAALSPKLLRDAEAALGVVVLEGYGLTETSPVIAVNTPEAGSQPGAVGPVLSNLELRLVRDDGSVVEVSAGQASDEGEIEVKGPSVMKGYFKLEQATREVLCEGGWFKTGDLGHINERGHLVISGGRKKDLIIKAGENIAPLRIEQALAEHEGIAEISVIGLPDEKVGELICACVIPKEDVNLSEVELKSYAREVLPPFLQPDRWVITQELPKTATGKILKRELREFVQKRELVHSI